MTCPICKDRLTLGGIDVPLDVHLIVEHGWAPQGHVFAEITDGTCSACGHTDCEEAAFKLKHSNEVPLCQAARAAS